MSPSNDNANVADSDSDDDLALSLIPGLPGETTVAAIGTSVLGLLPDSWQQFVHDNMSLRKPTGSSGQLVSNVNAEKQEKEKEMAGLPSLIKKAADAGAKAAPKSSTGAKLKRGAEIGATVGTVTWGVDSILDYAKEHYPSAYDAVASMFSGQGIDINSDQVRKGVGSTRDHLLAAFGRNGVDQKFVEAVGLNKKESAAMMSLITQYQVANVQAHDKNQTMRLSSGDVGLDQDIINIEISEVCALLGITGVGRAKQLYKVARVLNTITEGQVELFERHERLYGRIRTAL